MTSDAGMPNGAGPVAPAPRETALCDTPVRLVDRAYAQILEIIRQSDLKPGDRLPSESSLGASFGISRAIVREALVRLASDGLTESRRGAGSFVKSRPSDRLRSHLPADAFATILGSYEVRFVLESEAARLAATRRTLAQLDTIQRRLDALRRAMRDNGPAHQEDIDLHRAICEASGNSMFLTALDAMGDEIEPVMRAGVDISRSRSPEVVGVVLEEHALIVEAIRARDADGAALAMRWHLTQGRKRLLA